VRVQCTEEIDDSRKLVVSFCFVIQHILDGPDQVAAAASTQASALIRDAIAARGEARVVAATGSSQVMFLRLLVAQQDIPWQQVTLFHLDEYAGLPPDHPASMQRYIQERIVKPAGIVRTFLLDGTREETWKSAGHALTSAPVDVTFTGIGENGHLAFNEPPADFITEDPFIVVDLTEQTRQQQVREGWFQSLEQVPRQAVTMSIRQILKSRAILCIATGRHKALAVKQCFLSEISPLAPASALRLHGAATVYLDSAAGNDRALA
jgi:glucosamine-6-phosphate deaminase